MTAAPTMIFYTTVVGAKGRPRKVGITLPLVESIADLPHYQPPASREYELPQERRGHTLTKALVQRALGNLRFERTMRRISDDAVPRRDPD
jgi:hypothetical protein